MLGLCDEVRTLSLLGDKGTRQRIIELYSYISSQCAPYGFLRARVYVCEFVGRTRRSSRLCYSPPSIVYAAKQNARATLVLSYCEINCICATTIETRCVYVRCLIWRTTNAAMPPTMAHWPKTNKTAKAHWNSCGIKVRVDKRDALRAAASQWSSFLVALYGIHIYRAFKKYARRRCTKNRIVLGR